MERRPLEDATKANLPPRKKKCTTEIRVDDLKGAKSTSILSGYFDDEDASSDENWDATSAQQVRGDILEEMGVQYLDDARAVAACFLSVNMKRMSSDFAAELKPSPDELDRLRKYMSKHAKAVRSGRNVPLQAFYNEFVLHKRNKQEVDAGNDLFMKLSDETILDIFKWLPKPVLASCGRVCRRWSHLAFDESLWRRLDLAKRYLNPGVLRLVLSRGVVVLKLAMSEVKGPLFDGDTPLCHPVDSRFSKLQYLDLSMASISTNTLAQLLSTCSQLKKLSLEHCTLTDQICSLLAGNPDLECLNMAMSKGFTSEGLLHIAKGCRRLTAWNLAWTEMNHEKVTVLVENVTPDMRQLNIAGCRGALSDAHVQRLVAQCPGLTVLDISDAIHVTSEVIEAVASGLRDLKRLGVSRCYKIKPASYLTLNKMESLRHLAVFGVLADCALVTLRKGLPRVEINKELFSTVARPTIGISRRSSIWGLKVRD
ncbi:S-phase kinase-associated protein 2 isoform X1 [Ixodes scapularis]